MESMAAYSKVKPFNPKVGNWEVYEEQLSFYMQANGITDAAKKRSILLTVCGEQTFKLLRSVGSQEHLEEMLHDRLVCGVNHEGIQRKLYSPKMNSLTLVL